jgi:hypothetical protein
MVVWLVTQLLWSTLLLHGFPSPSLPFSLQIFHVIVVKKNCYHLWFPFIDDLKTYTTVQCANNKCKGQDEKALCKMFKPFCVLLQKGLHRKGYPRWLGRWLVICHPLVKIDKLPMLVGTKMYTFARFYLCNVSLSFHIIYCC